MKKQYQLLLEKFIKELEKRSPKMMQDVFICYEIETLKSKNLLIDFQSRKPSEIQYVEFYNHKLFNKDGQDSWWNCENEFSKQSNEQRVLFLKQIISEL